MEGLRPNSTRESVLLNLDSHGTLIDGPSGATVKSEDTLGLTSIQSDTIVKIGSSSPLDDPPSPPSRIWAQMFSVSVEVVSTLARLAFRISQIRYLIKQQLHFLALWVAEATKPSSLPVALEASGDWADVLALFDFRVLCVVCFGLLAAFCCGFQVARFRCGGDQGHRLGPATTLDAPPEQAIRHVHLQPRRALTPVQLQSSPQARQVRRAPSRPLRRSVKILPTSLSVRINGGDISKLLPPIRTMVPA